MAKYTIELGHLINSNFDIGLKDYPIFNENHRAELNRKIIEHYYFREIGVETPGLFKRFLNRKMWEIMPYYNKMFETELLEFDPLDTFNITESTTRDSHSTGNTGGESDSTGATANSGYYTDTGSASGKDVSSDTPQGMLSIGDIESNTYASNADIYENSTENRRDDNTRTDTTTHSESSANSETWLNDVVEKTRKGKDGAKSYAQLIDEYRKIILNIDLLIIDELNPLFMGCW